MAEIVLTNDRIVFAHETFGPTGSLVGGVIEAALEARADKKAGGSSDIARLAELRAASMQRRRMVPDLYMLTRADGSTVRLHRSLRKTWDPTIRRLLSERHGLALSDDGDGWRAEPA
jgi:hypothetical protein